MNPSEVRLTGGAARNMTWRQIAADVFDVEVVRIRVEEGAAYGAAIQALWTCRQHLGERTNISQLTDRFVELDEESRTKPDPERAEFYHRLQRLQDRLSLDLRGMFAATSRLLTTPS
jgi:xylulokinase